MEVIYKLINDLLETDKLGKQRVVTIKLAKGIEQYANQRVIDELEGVCANLSVINNDYHTQLSQIIKTSLEERIYELKQE